MLVAGCDPFEYDPGNQICYRKMKNILDIYTIFFFVVVVCFVNPFADVVGFEVVADVVGFDVAAAEVVVVAKNIQIKQI